MIPMTLKKGDTLPVGPLLSMSPFAMKYTVVTVQKKKGSVIYRMELTYSGIYIKRVTCTVTEEGVSWK